jgi:hypothetical protein
MNWGIRKWAIVGIFSAMVIGCSGCALCILGGAGVAAGVGTSKYIGGELKQAYAAPMEKTWNATVAAVDTLNMKTAEKSIDNLDQNRWIKGKTEGDKDFSISLEALAKDVTVVKVRIGTFGDEGASKKIQDLIAQNLKK